MREISYTARKVTSDEALRHGLVSQVLADRNTLMNEAICLAEKIAAKSPIAVQGTKKALVYARDHTVQDSLDQVVSCKKIEPSARFCLKYHPCL